MESLKNYIFKQVEENKLSPNDAKKLLLELKGGTSRVDDDIAVIGMACKFPGSKNVDEYWKILRNGVNCIDSFPRDRRKDGQVFYTFPNMFEIMGVDELELPENIDFEEDIYIKGGYLNEIDKFDAGFFRIPPREAKYMNPLQRVFLETAWEAVEDAGYGGNKIYGTKTGVFVGCDHTNVSLYRYITERDEMTLTGSWAGILATRISYIFNLRGPGLVIDTACSSGLTSVHEACLAIKNRDCDMALAGGINLSVVPGISGAKSAMGMVESSDFLVRTFDNKANGTVWGEGVGVLFLKPLRKAMADGDHIHAVIKGSALNNDGASNGITAPNAEAQDEMLLHAWKEAGVNPETISYIEAHGTGTVLGDPIEIKGLTNAFKRHTDKKQFCGIGSVKTNFGHLVAASGLASAIKVILALKNREIPPTINFKDPNQYINFDDSPVYVNDRLNPWERGSSPRRAGVNSFGFSGTNCHVIFEEAPEITGVKESGNDAPQILALSARSEKALSDLVDRYVEYINKNTKRDILSICYTANTGRGHFTCRLAMVVRNYADMKEKILKVGRTGFKGLSEEGIFYKEHKVVAESKKTVEENEVRESQKREFTRTANVFIKNSPVPEQRDASFLYEVCRLYVQGAEIEWDEYYRGQAARRVSIPAYPLERIRFWAEPKTAKNPAQEAEHAYKNISHPLIDRCMADSAYTQIYCTRVSVEKHWVLSDHRVMGNHVMPGTAYLEMAREACKDLYAGETIEIRDVMFISPLIVNKGESKEVHTILKKEDGYTGLVIASRQTSDDPDRDGKWITHVEARIYRNTEKKPEKCDIGMLIDKCNKKEINIYGKGSQGQLNFGPRWMNIDRVLVNENELLVRLELPVALQDDMPEYVIHPALMDNAVNTVIQGIGDGMYLPLSYGSLKIYGIMPHTFYSYLRRKDNQTGTLETVTFDVSLIDESGNCFIEVGDYSIKKVHAAELKFKELSGKSNTYYETGWIPSEQAPSERKTTEGPVLVIRDERAIADTFIQKLQDSGRKVVEAFPGLTEEEYRKLLERIKPLKPAQIIHFAEADESRVKGLYSLLYLTRALINSNFNEELEIVLVADNAYEVSGEEDKINPQHAALFGLAKVVSQEYPQLKCRCVDIDAATGMDIIMAELDAAGTAYPIAYRKGMRYAPEFRKLDIGTTSPAALPIRSEGVYIITGGTGGLGLEMAGHLASKANTNLALINRSRMPDNSEWNEILQKGEDKKLCKKIEAVRSVEAAGTKLELCFADIADESEMRALAERLRTKYGKINGIIHCAGVAGDGFIVRKDEKAFKNVISPKIEGTWVLDRVTEQDNLDFFVLFSSMATLTGGPGQGDYTAANAYLDSFAAYRSKQGKKTLSINWPAWKETGMAVDYGIDDSSTVFKSLTTAKALEIFDELLNSGVTRAYPGGLNYKLVSALKGQFPMLLSRQVAAAIEKYAAKNQPAGSSTAAKDTAAEIVIKGAGTEELSGTESRLAVIWARVLDLREIDIYENFHNLGGDSILATQLLKEIDKEYPGSISLPDIFSYPSVAELSKHLDTVAPQSGGTASKAGGTAESSSNTESKSSDSLQEDGPLVKVLDIGLQNEITTYLHHSLPLYALLHNEKLYPWFYEHFIQLFSFTKEGKNEVYFLETLNFFEDVAEVGWYGFDFLKDVSNIVEFIMEKINLGYYVIINVDEFYLPEKFHYNQDHSIHQSLIYGYDAPERKLFAVGFDNKHMYAKMKFDYDSFTAAYENGRLNYKERAYWCESTAICLFKPREIKEAYEFNVDRFLKELYTYIYSVHDDSRLYQLWQPAEILKYESKIYTVDKYGLEVYDDLLQQLQNMLEGVITTDYRAFHLLHQHKKGIYDRFKFIVSQYNMNDDNLLQAIEKYYPIIEQAGTARNMFFELSVSVLKVTENYAVNQYKVDIPEKYIAFIKQIMENISYLKEAEGAILEDVYTKLKEHFLS